MKNSDISLVQDVSIEEMYPLIDDLLSRGKRVTFKVSGWSMQPMIYHRRDTVTLVKPELPLKKYDLPFYRMDDGKFIMHRVIRIHKDGTYECRGDNCWTSEDNIRENQIIGVVKSFTRNGKTVEVEKSFGYFIYTRIWPFMHHFKWMYNYPKKSVKKIKQYIKHKKEIKPLEKKQKISLAGGKSMEIQYRSASALDLKKFFPIFEEFAKKEAEDYGNPIANYKWITTKKAKEFYYNLRQEHFFWLALDGGKIVGFCTGKVKKIEPRDIMVGEIINIYINEEYRSLGIGTELVNTFKQYCKKQNCNNITVRFFEKNVRAEKFYRKHGFSTYHRVYISEI